MHGPQDISRQRPLLLRVYIQHVFQQLLHDRDTVKGSILRNIMPTVIARYGLQRMLYSEALQGLHQKWSSSNGRAQMVYTVSNDRDQMVKDNLKLF